MQSRSISILPTTSRASSMNGPLLAGIDVGSTNIKAVVFDEHGAIVALASRKTPTHFPRPGWAYFEPRELWETTAAVLRDATAQVENPARIVGVGVASVGETGILIDAQGNELYEAIAWYDARSEPQGEQVEQILGGERIYSITGISPQAIFSICKILWIQQNEPEIFARAVRWLHVADYISWKLCGEAATDFSVASRTMALDLHGLRWSEEIINGVGLPVSLFAPLRRGGEPLGKVHSAAASATGLPQGAAVAVGGHDHLCGGLAIGAARMGAVLDSVGTAEALLLTIDRPLEGERVAQEGYEQGAHVAAGYYGMGAYRTAGACIDWFRTTCAGGANYDTLTAEAEAAPLGSLGVRFMPHMRLPHSPSNDPRSRGVFVGLSTDVTRGMMFRAILEGLAFETRNVLEPLLAYAGVERPTEVFVIGGAGRNPLFAQIKASILQQRLTLAQLDEETATGAALLGGMAAGLYASADEAQAALHVERTYVEPDPEQAERYERIFRDVYQKIYPSVRDLHHANAPLV
jgi:xylulokinase